MYHIVEHFHIKVLYVSIFETSNSTQNIAYMKDTVENFDQNVYYGNFFYVLHHIEKVVSPTAIFHLS